MNSLEVPLKHCKIVIWLDSKCVQTVFEDGSSCTAAREDTPENILEAEYQGYSGPDSVWRSLVEHELLHSLVAQVVFDRKSHVLASEAGIISVPAGLKYEEEAIILALQHYFNIGSKPRIIEHYVEKLWPASFLSLVSTWKLEHKPLLEKSVF